MSPPNSGFGAAAPTSTPLPFRVQEAKPQDQNGSSASSITKEFPQPRLRLQFDDITDIGSFLFLTSATPSTLFSSAVSRVQQALYVSPAFPGFHIPTVRSVTLIIRPMDGVAYTKGIDLDPEQHKEIHFSSRYIATISPERRAHEIEGVIVHELVHCFQYNGQGAAPGGLIEGIADWVRLKAGLAPPHWRHGDEVNGKWDAGYQNTAYFLQYLEDRFGDGTVRRINESLRVIRYEEKGFWTTILGRPVDQLWDDYKRHMSPSR
ncbi:BSP-domain-containing protein [Xylaria sp. CBS 124048]|nr:BSP-domain-containing protein [Xylaria sp. CBS 124048]